MPKPSLLKLIPRAQSKLDKCNDTGRAKNGATGNKKSSQVAILLHR